MSTFSINAEVSGKEELERKLRAISDNIRGQIALNAVTAGGADIEQFTKINIANVFSRKQSGGGGLAGSITVDASLDKDCATAVIAPHTAYDRIQELGGTITAHGGDKAMLKFQIDGQWYQKHSVTLPARPYLRPAWEEHQEEIFNDMKEQIERGLQ
jgi:phage gpG-like protein